MILKECMLIKNDMYIKAIGITNKQPTGIVVHSTGCNNPWLKRYVQPVQEQSYYDEVIADVGKNIYGNSWNNPGVGACVHAMIGKNANGIVETYQTLPYDYCAGGVANGTMVPPGTKYYSDANCSKYAGTTTTNVHGTGWTSGWAIKLPIDGKTYYATYSSGLSYNYNPNARIQFEIQEDNLTDETYFNEAFTEAIDYCVYLCKKFNLTVSQISSHKESYEAGYASGHGDPENWLVKFNKNMDWFRAEVQKKLGGDPGPDPDFKIGDEVRFKDTATTWCNGANIAGWVKEWEPLYVRDIKENGTKILVSTLQEGATTGWAWASDIELINPPEPKFEVGDEVKFKPTATTWCNGSAIPGWVLSWNPLYVRQVNEEEEKVLISTVQTGDVTGWAWAKDLMYASEDVVTPEPEPEPDPEPLPIPECNYEVKWKGHMAILEDAEHEVPWSVEGQTKEFEFVNNKTLFKGISCPDPDGNIYYVNATTGKTMWVYDYSNGWLDEIYKTIQTIQKPDEIFKGDDWTYFGLDNIDKVTSLKEEPTPEPDPEPTPDPTPDIELLFKEGDLVELVGEEIPQGLLNWKPFFVVSNKENKEIIVSAYKDGLEKFTFDIKNVQKYIPVNDSIVAGDIVSINSDAVFFDGSKIPGWAKVRQWIVADVKENKVIIDKDVAGKNSIYSEIDIKYLTEVKPQLAKVGFAFANVRKKPTIFSKIDNQITKDEYVIIKASNNGFWYMIGDEQWVFILLVDKVL